ncbi:MAG: signal recognition particle-docking protein FtsY [Pseudanabaenaceae cyanobacterium bins.39]|nr:signal recognition particle-docking protein FtsY [Pseudanabaenaceae cyanobacterium bins.39]
MVFNWFRRKYDDNKESSSQESTVTPEPTEDQEQDQPVETAPETPAVSQDLLNWAKVAYANVQQQTIVPDVSDISEPTPNIATESEPEAIEHDSVVVEESSAEVIDSVQPIEQPTDTSVVDESTPDTTLADTASETEAIASSESEDSAISSTEPLPFWMQSDRDRLARIAALEATAIAEPEVPKTPAPRRKATIKFDDDFIWSAEVLASQGRRPDEISVEEITWLNRLRQGLDKTRLSLVNQLKAIVGQGPLSADSVDDIEALLLQADVGVKATDLVISKLQDKLRKEVLPPEEAIAYLKQILREMLDIKQTGQNSQEPIPMLIPEKNQLNIWLITGVNGAGKTTTIGKLSHLSVKSGYKTLIAAADTFRAAAVDQVKTWGQRSNVEVIANPAQNADPAAVVFDAITAAQARGTELLLVDTAGRLQNKKNLMEELSKIRRIVDKKSADAKIESLLVLDSTLGQNGLKQAEVFAKSAGITGVILTKLDGTAKGGVAIAVVQQLGLPIRFIGAGEGIEDLRPFSSYEFVEALLSN